MPFIPILQGTVLQLWVMRFSVRCLTVAHFFYWRFFMKKKITNDEIGEIIGKMAEEVRGEMDYDFRVAQSQMWLAEKELADTFNQNQQALYQEFCKKRDLFYQIASEIYKKKF